MQQEQVLLNILIVESPDPLRVLETPPVFQSQDVELSSKWVVRLETVPFGLKSKNKKHSVASRNEICWGGAWWVTNGL